jgi:hypothetical protein
MSWLGTLIRRRAIGRAEGGYALALTALLLIPLMSIAAIGVDVGVWYLQAQENQRVADAASLAGVVLLPDQAAAQAAAFEAVERNGLQPGVDSTVAVDVLSDSELKVTVSTKSTLSLSNLFIDEFVITLAEYNPPVALGSPQNQLGSPGLWLAVSGRCSLRENGDLRSAEFLAGYPGGAYPPMPCAGGPNPSYETSGYLYSITVATPPGAPIQIEAFDASYSPDGNAADLELRPPSSFDITFTRYDAGGSPFDLTPVPVLATTVVGDRDPFHTGRWRTVATIPAPVRGTYYLRVQATGGGNESFGSNGFGLRAAQGGTFTSCTTLTAPLTCPQVAAVNDLSPYASLSNGSSTFYLAEIAAEHAGKSMEITLFDVGEGADSIEILDPDGNPVTFNWTTDCSIGLLPLGGCSGSTAGLDVSGSGPQIYPDTYSTSRYNDRAVVATVALPVDYATAYVGRWWQIRYTFGADITDRTTWSIKVIGDPVRLTR